MRPKKPRYIDSVQLADNLYPDPRKRPGYWRYARPNGTFKTFQAETPEEANQIANEANALRDSDLPIERTRPTREQLTYHVPLYIAYRQKLSPSLAGTDSWNNRRYALNQFAKAFPVLPHVTHDRIEEWWDGLTYHQQKLRMAEFRRFFNWLSRQNLTPRLKYNPFTTADDLPRLMLKEKPKKKRRPLTQEGYALVHAKAGELGYEVLQLAMAISRYTTLREGDLCTLRLDRNIVDGERGKELRVVVSKSVAQKGTARATRLCWVLADHPILKGLISRARELSLLHKRCPFVLSHKPKRRVWNEQKEHLYQVTGERLSRMFAEVRDAVGEKAEGTSFHEVRGLSSTLLKKAGYTNEEIKNLMAHESVATTLGYQNAEDLPYQEVNLRLEA